MPALADVGAGGITSIRVVRHKPGRRCLVAYELHGYGTVYGKVARKRYGKAGYRLLAELRRAGFDGAADGIAVPEPIGVAGALRMWLQREAPGRPVTHALEEPGSEGVALRVAEAAHKLHAAGVPTERRHGVADELRILEDCLGRVGASQPRLASRLRRLVERCARAGARLDDRQACGVHRDFYPDQVLVDGARVTVLDFDLYCVGDPALDIGNFLGHVTEQALRTRGSATAFGAFEHRLQERFGELAGAEAGRRVRIWAALTLARHVYLSTRFEDRRRLTAPLLDLAEQRLAEAWR